MTNPQSPEYMIALAHAESCARVAQSRGYELPEDYQRARDVADAAQRLAAAPEPIIPATLPDANKLPAHVAKLAAERLAWREQVAVARQIVDTATRTAARAALDTGPALVERIATETNTVLIPTLCKLLDTAPRTLTGYENDQQLSEHRDLLRVVEAITAAAVDRMTLASASSEGGDLGRVGAVFLLVSPPGDTTVSAVDTAAQDMAERGIPATIEAWAALRPLGLLMAHLGEAATRYGRYTATRANLARTPDGGMREHTIDELADLAPAVA